MNMAQETAFERVTGDNVETFKHTIRLCLFPVGYPKSFFKDVVGGKVNAFLLVVGSGVVGCMAWRETKDKCEVEILIFGLLPLQRRKGYGSKMLQFLLNNIGPGNKLTLHVHVANEDAVAFYRAKGFGVAKRVERYYPRLQPSPDAYYMVLERDEQCKMGIENGVFSDLDAIPAQASHD